MNICKIYYQLESINIGKILLIRVWEMNVEGGLENLLFQMGVFG